MPAPLHAAGPAGFVIDRDTHTIRFERDFTARPGQVFTAWTVAEHVARWWDPEGEPLTVCDIDLRPGGSFRFVSRGHPEMPFGGTYSEIAPPDRLIFEAMGATGRVLLAGVGAGTHMTVEIACTSADQLDQYIRMGVHLGTDQTMNNLVGYLAQETAAA
jgi:uncharacterized protein YndB with AHSA1/START domain